MTFVPAAARRQPALRRKRRAEGALGAFELDPVRILDVAREIAAFDSRSRDYEGMAFKRTRQRIVDAIKRNELPVDKASTSVAHEDFCRWAETTWGDKPWFARVREIKGFRLYPSVGTSTASLPMIAIQADGFQWVDDYAWLREHYLVSEAGRLQLLAENTVLKHRNEALEREVKHCRERAQRLSDQNRENRLQRELKRRG